MLARHAIIIILVTSNCNNFTSKLFVTSDVTHQDEEKLESHFKIEYKNRQGLEDEPKV